MATKSARSKYTRGKSRRCVGAPLEGLRVFDMTQIVAGPFCTTMLANLGAEVVKLESLGRGDDLRSIGRYEGRAGHEDYFNANNYSKKSIALNLKVPAQREVARALARKADVFVENFAPGTARRLGMGWQSLHRMNPRLVYCSISGFGQTGPYSDRLAMDIVIQAISGVMSVTGEEGGRPVQIGAPLADVISGMFAAYAVVGALHSVKQDGKGRYIDLSMQAAMIATLGPRMGQPCRPERPRRRLATRTQCAFRPTSALPGMECRFSIWSRTTGCGRRSVGPSGSLSGSRMRASQTT